MNSYLVIGSGRWASHLCRLLQLQGVPFSQWSRGKAWSEQSTANQKSDNINHLLEPLIIAAHKHTHIWLAVSDHAIQPLAQEIKAAYQNSKILLHSSGVLEIENVHSLHPLMSFSHELYSDSFYSRLQMVTTSPLDREILIPGLANPLAQISIEDKARYHALCVLAGNGSVLLWQKFFAEMKKLNITNEAAHDYCERIFLNLQSCPETALTGPLVRNDRMTMLFDLQALQDDPFQSVLHSLFEAYHKQKITSVSTARNS